MLQSKVKTQRTLDFKVLAVLTVAVVGLVGGVYALHGFQVKRHARVLLRLADQAEDQGQTNKAIELLERYVNLRRDDEAAARLGLLLEKTARTPRAQLRAYLVLGWSISRSPDRQDLLRKAAALAMNKLGRFGDARRHLEALLNHHQPDAETARMIQQGELERSIGECADGEGKFDEAVEWFEKSIKRFPKQIDSYSRLATLLRRDLRQAAEADKIITDLVQANQESPLALLTRARYRNEFGLEGTDQDISQARKLAPDDPEVILASANWALKQAKPDLDTARLDLERGMALAPEDRRMYQELARLELRADRAGSAVACLRKGLASLRDSADLFELKVALADSLIVAGHPGDAAELLVTLREEAKKNDTEPPSLDLLDARIMMTARAWTEAIKILDSVRLRIYQAETVPVEIKRAIALQVDLMLAQCQEALGKPELLLEACNRALSLDPSSVPALRGKAGALTALGKRDQALVVLKNLGSQTPDTTLAAARLTVLETLAHPAAERQWGEAERLVDQADRVNPGNIEVPILRAEVWLARNQPDRARDTLQKARAAHPDRVEPWLALAALAAREETRTPGTDKPEAALAVLDQARAKLGDRIELKLARARFLAGLGGDSGRRGLAELAGALDRISGNDQRALLNSLAAAYQIVGDTKRAEQLWSRLAEQERGDPVVRLALFELAAARNDDLAMQRLISQLRDIEGEDGASWRFAEAKRLVVTARQSPNDQQGDRSRASTALKQAHDLLVEAAKRRASWPLIPALGAEIALLENDPNEAIEQYRQAIKLGDRRIEVVRALVQLLFQRGRLDEAREALRELPPDTPLSGPMGQMAAELTLRDKNPKRGLELTSQVVRADSKDYRDQVWRGSMFSRAGPERRAEAETAFRQAISLAGGKEPVTWLALVDFLARSNQRDKALAAIKQAERDLPSDQRSLTLAQCWGIVGDREKAVIQYQAALKAQPSNVLVLRSFAAFLVQAGQPREAQTLLRQLLDPALNAPAEEVRLARRILAVSLPDEGDPRKLQEALTLIDANLSTDVPSDRDLQTKMLLLTRQPGRRTEAIRMMEEIVRGSTATPRDQLVLAQLYDEDKQWPAARRILLQLVASQGDDPLYLAYAAGALLQHNDPDAAQGMIGRLESREPNSLRTLELKVRWLLAKGRPREGIPPLEQYARANPSDRIVIARLIEMLSPPEGSATAEAIYRDVAAQSDQPYGVLILAQYYARHGRLDQALDLCERAGNAVPPDVVARNFMMSLDLVRPRPSDAQIKRVDHWLDLAVERHPNLVELRIQQALIRTLQGRYDESAAIYRRILDTDPSNTLCLNNLAYLLAVNSAKGDEALKLIDQAIASSGPFPSMLDTRALALMALGRGGEAIQDLEAAIAQGAAPSTTRNLHFHMARAHLMEKDQVNAQNALQRAVQAGLKAEDVDPRERSEYDRLVGELKAK